MLLLYNNHAIIPVTKYLSRDFPGEQTKFARFRRVLVPWVASEYKMNFRRKIPRVLTALDYARLVRESVTASQRYAREITDRWKTSHLSRVTVAKSFMDAINRRPIKLRQFILAANEFRPLSFSSFLPPCNRWREVAWKRRSRNAEADPLSSRCVSWKGNSIGRPPRGRDQVGYELPMFPYRSFSCMLLH